MQGGAQGTRGVLRHTVSSGLFVSALLLLVVMVGESAGSAQAQGSAPSLSISPTSGPVGTSVSASGTAPDGCDAITLTVARPAGGAALVREQLAAQPDGSYRGMFVVPEGGTPSGETPDEFIVRAFCADGSSGTAEASFTVTAPDTDQAPAPSGGVASGAGGTASTGRPWWAPLAVASLVTAGSLRAASRRRARSAA